MKGFQISVCLAFLCTACGSDAAPGAPGLYLLGEESTRPALRAILAYERERPDGSASARKEHGLKDPRAIERDVNSALHLLRFSIELRADGAASFTQRIPGVELVRQGTYQINGDEITLTYRSGGQRGKPETVLDPPETMVGTVAPGTVSISKLNDLALQWVFRMQ